MLKVSRILLSASKPPNAFYLNVPFKDKDQVKAIVGGSQFDWDAKKWWATDAQRSSVTQWTLPGATQPQAPPEKPEIVDPVIIERSSKSKPFEGIYLKVPFAEKGEAQAAGARWDGEAKKWYAPNEWKWEMLKKWHDPACKPEEMVEVTTGYLSGDYSSTPRRIDILVPKNAIIIYNKVLQYLNHNNHYRYTMVYGIIAPSLGIEISPKYMDKFTEAAVVSENNTAMQEKAKALAREHGLRIIRAEHYTEDD